MTHQFDSQTFVRRMEAAGMARAVAEGSADSLRSTVLGDSVRQRNLHETENRLRGHLRETELRLGQQIKELELRVTVRMWAMAAATIAILGALITLN